MANFTRSASVSDIMTSVMTSIGLTPPTSFVDSTDLTVLNLLTYFNRAGKSLAAAHDWQELHSEWTLTTTTDTNYPLPADWNGFVDGAAWSNSQRWPMIGSIAPQTWRMLKARLSGGAWAMIAYKIQNDELVLFNAPTAGQVMVMDYYSGGWLRNQADPSITYDNYQADSDVCVIDAMLVELATEFLWRASKGFDTASIQTAFNNRWDAIVGRDTPAPTYSIGPRRTDGLLGYYNIPDTNYGS